MVDIHFQSSPRFVFPVFKLLYSFIIKKRYLHTKVGIDDMAELSNVVRSFPEAAEHESCRSLLRACIERHEPYVLCAFTDSAGVIFDEFEKFMLWSGGKVDMKTCEPIVQLLLKGNDNPGDKEFLLGEVQLHADFFFFFLTIFADNSGGKGKACGLGAPATRTPRREGK